MANKHKLLNIFNTFYTHNNDIIKKTIIKLENNKLLQEYCKPVFITSDDNNRYVKMGYTSMLLEACRMSIDIDIITKIRQYSDINYITPSFETCFTMILDGSKQVMRDALLEQRIQLIKYLLNEGYDMKLTNFMYLLTKFRKTRQDFVIQCIECILNNMCDINFRYKEFSDEKYWDISTYNMIEEYALHAAPHNLYIFNFLINKGVNIYEKTTYIKDNIVNDRIVFIILNNLIKYYNIISSSVDYSNFCEILIKHRFDFTTKNINDKTIYDIILESIGLNKCIINKII